MLFSRRKRAVPAEPPPEGMGIARRNGAATTGHTNDTVLDTQPPAPLPIVAAPLTDSPAIADTAPQHLTFEPAGFGIPIEPVAPAPHDAPVPQAPSEETGAAATNGNTNDAVLDPEPPAPLPSVAAPLTDSPAIADTAPQHGTFEPVGFGIPIEPVAPAPHDTPVPQAPGEETGVADLNEFFAALRHIVDDSLARLPLESDRLEPQQLDEAEQLVRDIEADREPLSPAGHDGAPAALARRPENGIARRDAHTGEMVAPTDGHASPPSTELAPSTAELIAALEADRDRWRERAVVWRERAMGADLVVKSLNDHMADLRDNLEDFRMVIRAMSSAATASTSSTDSENHPTVAPTPPRPEGGTEPSED